MVTGYGEEAGNALVDHPDVPMITFTGSSTVGKKIMERSAKYLKHLSLELGGNDPVIVCRDADPVSYTHLPAFCPVRARYYCRD